MLTRLFLLLFLGALTATGHAQNAPSLQDQARFLAGLPVRNSALDQFAHQQLWVEHATAMDSAFGKSDQRQLARVRSWAGANVPGSRGSGPMFYLFSGPDFLYANAFYPNASTYILAGTEPVGAVPDITRIPPDQLEIALAALRNSMKTMLSFHYFITKEMRVELNRTNLGGTLPILYVFLARTGHTIREVQYVSSPAQGVRIVFDGGQTLYYFKTDLSNGGGSKAFYSWCERQGKGMSLLKAASYLLHSDSFSTARRFVLNNSSVIVQDDSGVPLRAFDPSWNVRLFGSYTSPIELFTKNYQPELAQAYSKGAPGLPFAFGYHWQQEKALLMVAEKR